MVSHSTKQFALVLFFALSATALETATLAQTPFIERDELQRAQEKVVKIFGAGGVGSLEAYQTGLLISSSKGHILTVDSTVLDEGVVTIITANGDRYSGNLLGADPLLRVALLQINTAGTSLPMFNLQQSPTAEIGEPILALSNAFGIAAGAELMSVFHGVIAARATLRLRHGAIERINIPNALVLDAVTSNPGAAGGAVINLQGQLLGMLGKEYRSEATGAWISYALTAADLTDAVDRIQTGQNLLGGSTSKLLTPPVDTLANWGFAIMPSITPRTPPYVDYVRPNTPSHRVGLKPDDLVVMVNGLVTASCQEFHRVTALHSTNESLSLTIKRGLHLVELELAPQKQQEAP